MIKETVLPGDAEKLQAILLERDAEIEKRDAAITERDIEIRQLREYVRLLKSQQ
ncbi:MAG: hypothetical protein GY937_12305, partial [bacterium]|nr:hypothetical protein [bacterium]